MKEKKRKPIAEKAKYQATVRERNALVEIYSKSKAKETPRVKVTPTGENTAGLSLDHPKAAFAYPLLMKAIGTTDYDFIGKLLEQLANAVAKGKQTDEAGLNFMISVIKGIQPRDQTEAMLAAHMAAVHMAIMNYVQQLANVGNNMTIQESTEGGLNKLVRTYAMQMETLKRYRTGGEQKVTVQHVSVGEGGQAIVGNVTQAAPKKDVPPKPAIEAPALTDARQVPMMTKENIERTPVVSQRKRKDAKRSSA